MTAYFAERRTAAAMAAALTALERRGKVSPQHFVRLTRAYLQTRQLAEWPLVDDWATPTFYFLQRGRLVAKVSGWPKEGRRAELVATLRKLGLL